MGIDFAEQGVHQRKRSAGLGTGGEAGGNPAP
jgi:hypothetical protein